MRRTLLWAVGILGMLVGMPLLVMSIIPTYMQSGYVTRAGYLITLVVILSVIAIYSAMSTGRQAH